MEAPPLTGTVHPGFEPVREVFAELLRSGAETGAGLAVYRDGRLLVDLVGGWATTARFASWSRDTLVHTYSVSKPFAALAALTLVADGRLELDAPLAVAWPSYAANGKSRTTLRDALSHRAAQPAFPDGLQAQDLYDAPLLEAALASAPPEWDPGTAPAEHALTYGHVLSGLVRAATGQGLGDIFRNAIAGPLGLDAHFGVPTDSVARVAEVEPSTPAWPTATAGAPGSLRWRALTRPPGALDPTVLNGRRWRAGEFPAIGLHATAASIARFYGELLDHRGAVATLLGPELYRAYLDPAVTAHDRLLDREVTWSLGLQVDEYGAGMAGIGGCDAYADTRLGFGYAYLTRRLDDHSRSERILASLESVLS
jgi:CubicO group peptidase (beta-lactamase class C family)